MNTISVNQQSFTIIKLLGKGKGGYSYLVTDGNRQFVCKQIHHEPCSYYSFGNKIEAEIRDYHTLKEIGIPLPELLDVDKVAERILKEYIDGPTAYDLILEDRMKNDYIQQLKHMCSLLYPAQINIDYFPTNFVIQEEKLYYIDYECNAYMEEWNFENWGSKYWSKTTEFWEYYHSHKKGE